MRGNVSNYSRTHDLTRSESVEAFSEARCSNTHMNERAKAAKRSDQPDSALLLLCLMRGAYERSA